MAFFKLPSFLERKYYTGPILPKMVKLYRITQSNSVRSILYQSIILLKQVERLMTPDQKTSVNKLVSELFKNKYQLKNDTYVTQVVGKINQILQFVKNSYDTAGKNNPGQLRSYAVRNIMAKLTRSSNEAETMQDRRYIYATANKIQQNIFKFTDGELKRMNDMVNSEPNDQLSLAIINSINKIIAIASRRQNMYVEPMMLKNQRRLINRNNSRLISNNPIPLNY